MLRAKSILNNSLYLFLSFSLAVYSTLSLALSSDQDQPIEVAADYAELDDAKGLTIYKGDVVVTQGSMKVTGDELTVTYTEAGDMDTMIVIGKPAHFEQMPDNSKVKDEAEALRIEYYSLKNLMYLIKKAVMKQEDSHLSGDKIEYNTLTNKIISKGSAKASSDKNSKKDGNGRVKIILKQKKKPSTE